MTRQEAERARKIIDTAIALAPLAVFLSIQYRDEIRRLRAWVMSRLTRNHAAEELAVQELRADLSRIEHGS